ncbi:MAG TPA: hypothetical protein PKY01_05925 [Candidatus Hydrogenedentes bacterium]|nr:hypothetical protein [Candidatus Hydrogenedentota bacterium]
MPHARHFLKNRGGTLTSVHTAMIANMIVTYIVADICLEASVWSPFIEHSEEGASCLLGSF